MYVHTNVCSLTKQSRFSIIIPGFLSSPDKSFLWVSESSLRTVSRAVEHGQLVMVAVLDLWLGSVRTTHTVTNGILYVAVRVLVEACWTETWMYRGCLLFKSFNNV